MDQQRQRDDEDVIISALNSLKNATGIPVTMYAAGAADGRLRISKWVGLRTPALHNLEIAPGAGVGGRVMTTRRPVGVSDYTRAKSISHDFDRHIRDEGLHSVVAVPVIVKREVRGVLYAGVHSRARMGDKVLEEVTMTARCLEQDFAVNEAMRETEAGGGAATGASSTKQVRSMSGAEWEQVRATHSKLRMLANRVEDEELRRDLEVLCDQMVSPVRVKQTTKLSARELDVLACVALGHTNVEAAAEMGIGAETVKSYLRSVMRKLGAHTRYEAVNAARRIGALP
ncbi:acetate metabolism transcriptional regulator RamA [Corynebacterium macclintockiae]|uniref:LuxR C-terminal-related transcriptional regulator n=1 Tax=Corynebacterium macclintockiae TaxID=2913501 RepID=A0A9X3RS65_9CORY|nr:MULTISPECIES: acetate metabolism transcriptional regulator RamA [Corynebacterium]MBC6795909.1 helix-turn-helix transcriptional regulator [Corynebacterium sp. LK28]MCZ9305752.1 LuxR C-terminal-related transcriptional regulator [Corynebacterium macclintockiae]MDK8870819.1 acetate metabolism transcriptional regulator RamA [Corynebacterium macclintockiae]MDK8891759.1 acetate metabolism transcriptional regulator RamA [Corynebacterium macclintockiae]OFM54736.1 helix-turn-helix transcriptional reg